MGEQEGGEEKYFGNERIVVSTQAGNLLFIKRTKSRCVASKSAVETIKQVGEVPEWEYLDPTCDLILSARGLVQSNDPAVIEFILGLDDHQFARVDGVANDIAICQQITCTLVNVFLDCGL